MIRSDYPAIQVPLGESNMPVHRNETQYSRYKCLQEPIQVDREGFRRLHGDRDLRHKGLRRNWERYRRS